MAIIKTYNEVDAKQQDETVDIRFICPVCKREKILKVNKLIINQSNQLLTISIPKNKICPHHFQAFIDKNFKVRGYQKVDFSFEQESSINLGKKTLIENLIREDYELFKSLRFKGNTLEYMPNDFMHIKKLNSDLNKTNLKKQVTDNSHSSINHKTQKDIRNNKIERKSMTLQEIYEEFWEFIDEKNYEFREFIINDPRRTKKS